MIPRCAYISIRVGFLLACLVVAGTTNVSAMHSGGELLDLKSVPLADWLVAGETTQIPWKLEVAQPFLRMDQRCVHANVPLLADKRRRE